jgi:hypothetical protein
MSVHVDPERAPDSEIAWIEGEAAVAIAMSEANIAAVALVEAMVDMLARNGWYGWGINSPEHWLCWKANISAGRADGIVRIAQRKDELPECWALFAAGKVTEDAMVRIARRVPGSHDAQVAGVVTMKTISQLSRALACLPELPKPDKPDDPPEPNYHLHRHRLPNGEETGSYHLPAELAAQWELALTSGRDAEFRDRNDLPLDAEVGDEARAVTWVDAMGRVALEATDALDTHLRRTGHAGERHQVVLHHHVDHEGRMGPGGLHLGGFVTDPVARYHACDAQVIVMAYRDGKLLGINPTERTPSRRLRRYLEHRDGGCAFPLCLQKRWLHAHHLLHWEDGGPTEAWNLVCFCPLHHRGLHAGDFTVEGNPEVGTLVFEDKRGRRIEPPALGAELLPQPPAPVEVTYTQPYGGRLSARDFHWN